MSETNSVLDTQDDWLDKVPGKHRLVFDTTTPDGFGYALLYASNYFIASRTPTGWRTPTWRS